VILDRSRPEHRMSYGWRTGASTSAARSVGTIGLDQAVAHLEGSPS
jgi:hypothetical protein